MPLVSADRASNLGKVFGLTIGNTIAAIPAVAGWAALGIDPDQDAAAYRERIVGPVRGLLTDSEGRIGAPNGRPLPLPASPRTVW